MCLNWKGYALFWIIKTETLIKRSCELSPRGSSERDSSSLQTRVVIRYWKTWNQMDFLDVHCASIKRFLYFYRANKAYRVRDHIDTGNAVRIYFLEWNFRYISALSVLVAFHHWLSVCHRGINRFQVPCFWEICTQIISKIPLFKSWFS